MGSGSLGSQNTVVAGHRAPDFRGCPPGLVKKSRPPQVVHDNPRKVLRSFCELKSGMTFREPLTFLGLSLFPCKWRVYLPIFTSRPFEDFGGVHGALCLSGESLPPYSAGGAGRGPRKAQRLAPVPQESPQGQVGARVPTCALHKASVLTS